MKRYRLKHALCRQADKCQSSDWAEMKTRSTKSPASADQRRRGSRLKKKAIFCSGFTRATNADDWVVRCRWNLNRMCWFHLFGIHRFPLTTDFQISDQVSKHVSPLRIDIHVKAAWLVTTYSHRSYRWHCTLKSVHSFIIYNHFFNLIRDVLLCRAILIV